MEYRNQGDEIGIQNSAIGYNHPPGRGSAFFRPTFSTPSSLLSPRTTGDGGNRNAHMIANTTPPLPQHPVAATTTIINSAATTTITSAATIHSHDISSPIDNHSFSSEYFGNQIPDPAAPVSNSSQDPSGGAGSILSNSNHSTDIRLANASTTTNAGVVNVTCRYSECRRNHAASVGGHVLDGCGEFMPNGDPSTLEFLKCAACGCHRSFHRKEAEASESNGVGGGKSYYRGAPLPLLLPPPNPWSPHARKNYHYASGGFSPIPSSRAAAPLGSSVVMAFGINTSESGGTTTESSSEERIHHDRAIPTPATSGTRKRFRTKFTPEQKEKMLVFAERISWRFQKQDEAAIEQFCAEAGVRRHVLKVWMHNNKHSNRKHEQRPSEHDEILPQQHRHL